MKKIPFYNPASPLFFHIAVLLLYTLIFVLFFVFPIVHPILVLLTILLFSTSYPFFALAMAILVRRAYINTYQTSVPEQFTNKLLLYNRYLITAIYVIFSIGGWLLELPATENELLYFLLLFASGLCFLFYLFILPIIIRLILLKKINLILEIIILGIFFFLFLLGSYIINIFW